MDGFVTQNSASTSAGANSFDISKDRRMPPFDLSDASEDGEDTDDERTESKEHDVETASQISQDHRSQSPPVTKSISPSDQASCTSRIVWFQEG